jgi:hypothetical protein
MPSAHDPSVLGLRNLLPRVFPIEGVTKVGFTRSRTAPSPRRRFAHCHDIGCPSRPVAGLPIRITRPERLYCAPLPDE